jgi:hypothetical protein
MTLCHPGRVVRKLPLRDTPTNPMKNLTLSYDVVVCGGGLAGFCAAVAAARRGATVALVQDRPVLGGNASSEIRVTVHGATGFHSYARETGILSELLTEERVRNHEPINENGWTNSVFDQVLYDLAQRTPGLTLHLNTAVHDVLLGDDDLSGLSDIPNRPLPDTTNGWYHRPACAPRKRIAAVVARVANAETTLTLRARTFIDATGDGLVADLAGCGWRMGSESKEQTGEVHAPAAASTNTMGNSIHIRARDIGRPAPFTPPSWAKTISDADFFHKKGRHLTDLRGGYWWIEIGMPWHTIHDNETIRHELTAWALAIWDWIKNHDATTKDRATNYALEWIGQVPGKRESRRIDGLCQFTEHDIQDNVKHPDEIAFGGWFVDLHTPGGLLAEHSEPAAGEGYAPDSDYAAKSYVGPYGIPLRAHIARDVDNLFLAGRCLSATHAALGTTRVMATTAIVGQALGTGAALALEKDLPLARLPDADLVSEIQQRLLRDGAFLPNHANTDPADLARTAVASASSSALNHGAGPHDAWISNGLERQPTGRGFSLVKAAAQWIAVAGGRLDSVSACLDNASAQPQRVRARLVRVEHIWDYRRDLPALAETELLVSPGEDRWIEWPAALTGLAAGYVRLDIVADCADVSWRHASGILPGQVSAWAMNAKKLRRVQNGATLAFRVSPAQPAYGPEQTLTGVARPHRATNLWRSDPGQPMPQSLQLAWSSAQRISTVELTFPGHILRQVHAYPPFFRDPQTPRDYAIEALVDGAWTELHVEKGNYQRHRRHVLPAPVTTERIRIVIQATNGDPSAALYEIRAYAE